MSLILALVLTLCVGVFGKYDENLARYDLYPLASAAYDDHPDLCVWDNFKNSTFIRQYSIKCDPLKEDTCSGFTAVSHTDKAIILTFRGSIDMEVLFEVIDEMFKKRTSFIGGGTVSVYFWTAFNGVWTNGMRDDLLAQKNANPGYELWITGHSLGAAMASICAGYIAKLGYFTSNQIKLATFGQPRVGDQAYADFIDAKVPHAYRVIHHDDMVAHLPPLNLEWVDPDLKNYTHHKSEIWYNNTMAVGMPYLECDANEGSGCSDVVEKNIFDYSIPDHDFYFDKDVGFATDGCPGYNPNGKKSFKHKYMRNNKKH